MIPLRESGSVGMTCPNCGWGWVTTDTSGIAFDANRYTIVINKVEKPNFNAIKAVSKAFGCNFIEAREYLLKGHKLADCSASERQQIEEMLQTGQVKYETDIDTE